MSKIRLNKIVLQNWKAQNREVTFNETTTTIKGRNGSGKSSIIKAWNWLLTGYSDAITQKNSNLFDLTKELSKDTPIASVKAFISIDGIEYTLERTAKAKFIREKGSKEYTKASSDEYKTYIDNIEFSATNFAKWIDDMICPVDMVQYCLDGSFFSTLCENDKKSARKALERIVGEITMNDFKGDYGCILSRLDKYTIEQIEEQIRAEIKPIKQREEELPAVIKSKEALLAEYNQTDFRDVMKRIEGKNDELDDINKQMLGVSERISPIVKEREDISMRIESLKNDDRNKRTDYNARCYEEVAEKERELKNIEGDNLSIKYRNEKGVRDWNEANDSLSLKKKMLDELNKRITRLRNQKDEIKNRVFTEGHCSYCGSELTGDLLEDAKSRFNTMKKMDYDSVVKEGKNVAEQIRQLESAIEDCKEIVDKGYVEEPLKDASELKKEIESIHAGQKPYEMTEEHKAIARQIESLERSMPNIPLTNKYELEDRYRVVLSELEALNRTYGIKSKADELSAEIGELYNEKKEVACQLAELEEQQFACKEYIQERAEIISDRINKNLLDCKISMWSQQKNGNMVGDCIITDNEGVKYATLNNSARIKTNISIQKMFCKHYGIDVIVFVDESSIFDSESLPNYLDSQIVYLFASDDNELIVE